MRRVALKGLWWRRGRAVLTAFAVVLGVAMVSGTFVLTDTINKAFDSIFQDSYSKTSAVISGREVVKDAVSGNATVPASLLDRVRANGDVAEATGAIFNLSGLSDSTKLIAKDGKRLGSSQNGQFGFGFDPQAKGLNPLSLTAGRWATGPGQVVVDKGTAQNNGLDVGETVGVAARGPVRQYRITGIARYGTVDSIGGSTIAVFDVPTAQALLGKRGQYDTILVAARDGVSPEQLVRELRPIVPAAAQVKTGQQQADANAKDTQEQSKFVQYFLLGFGFIALGVGAFVIFNTLSITLAQRIRELATLRTLGASKRQVKRSVLTEGLVMGVFASLVGLVLGVALAKGLNLLFEAFGVDLPSASMVVEPRTIIVALALGIVVTLIASISPARRATQIAPVAALREGATLPPRLGSRRPSVPARDPRRRRRGLRGGRGRHRSDRGVAHPGRRRGARPLPRRDHGRRAPGAAARRRAGRARAALRRPRRPARQRQRDAQHHPDRDDRRRAHDRAGARDARAPRCRAASAPRTAAPTRTPSRPTTW